MERNAERLPQGRKKIMWDSCRNEDALYCNAASPVAKILHKLLLNPISMTEKAKHQFNKCGQTSLPARTERGREELFWGKVGMGMKSVRIGQDRCNFYPCASL